MVLKAPVFCIIFNVNTSSDEYFLFSCQTVINEDLILCKNGQQSADLVTFTEEKVLGSKRNC